MARVDEFTSLLGAPTKRSEKAILNDTLVAVSALPNTLVYRQNTGQAWQGERLRFYPGTNIPVPHGVVVLANARPVNFGLEGAGDIVGTHHGSALQIEVKDEKGRQSGVQRNFQLAWERAGGIYLLVRSAAEAVSRLSE